MTKRLRTRAWTLAAALALPLAGPARADAPFLYAWASDGDEKESDFLAVVDADPASASYGKVVATAPSGVRATMAHHSEYETPPGDGLFVSGFKAGQNFVYDLSDPRQPKVRSQFARAGEHGFAHSFVRTPSGTVLSTFQSTGPGYAPPGALVELDADGKLLRHSPSKTPALPDALNWPYSLEVVPALDRVVTTSTDMGTGPGWVYRSTAHVQLWSLSGLELLHTIALPETGRGTHHMWPAEPRLLEDGTVYVNSFRCGLYKLDGIDGPAPSARFVHGFPVGESDHETCAVPLVVGRYWIQTVGKINGLIVLDASNPDHPVEVSRLVLPHRLHGPHWIAADRSGDRIVATGMNSGWMAMLRFDRTTGRLSLDERFGEKGAIDFDRPDWPHGPTGKAIVHGTVFSR